MFRDVSLAEMLDAREMRSIKRQKMSSLHQAALIQLSINSPGSEKNSLEISEIFSEGLQSILKEFDKSVIEFSVNAQLNTGPEAFIAIECPALEIKKRSCDIESSHPLGRLWDIDVYDRDLRPLSRREIGLPERQCYLCTEPAHVCARSRKHSREDLKKYILDIYHNFSDQHGIL